MAMRGMDWAERSVADRHRNVAHASACRSGIRAAIRQTAAKAETPARMPVLHAKTCATTSSCTVGESIFPIAPSGVHAVGHALHYRFYLVDFTFSDFE